MKYFACLLVILGFIAASFSLADTALLLATPPNHQKCLPQSTGCATIRDFCSQLESCKMCTGSTLHHACQGPFANFNCGPATAVGCGILYTNACIPGSGCPAAGDPHWSSGGGACDISATSCTS